MRLFAALCFAVLLFLALFVFRGLPIGIAAKDCAETYQIKIKDPVRVAPTPPEPKRKNTRPPANTAPVTSDKGNDQPAKSICEPCFEYRFEQPGRKVQSVRIIHDSDGKGFIYFFETGMSGEIAEPLALSDAIMERLRAAFTALDFLNSTENYQYEKDYPHLGTVSITLRQSGRQRTATFNWTTNQWAKILMDEYRRISQRELWLFDFAGARENQPLETPSLLDKLESLLDLNEIADPSQILPVLRKYEIDERLPLISRNHISRLIKRIEKPKRQ